MNTEQAMEKGWHKRAKEKIEKLNGQQIASDRKCLTGDAAEKTLEFADAKKADVIVMGSSSGLKGISKKALGSVTRKVSELANCPVLIVH